MHILDILYNKYYLPTLFHRVRNKKNNCNQNFTLLCANCMGGYIYHQLGVKFQSPTINLMMLQTDFIKMISDLPHYLSLDFVEKESKSGCPVGMLGDITVYFTHYSSFPEAISAWKKRAKRVNYDNLYIIASDRDGMTRDDIERLGNVKCKKLVCFTAKKYEYPWCFQVKEFENDRQIGSILKKTITGKWKFETFFDYIGWLNGEGVIAEDFRIGKANS